MPVCAVGCVTGEELCTWGSVAFMGNGNKPALCLGGDITSSLKVAYRRRSPEKRPGKEQSGLVLFRTQQERAGMLSTCGGAPPPMMVIAATLKDDRRLELEGVSVV